MSHQMQVSGVLLVATAITVVILERTRPFDRIEIPFKVIFSDFLHWLFRVLTSGFDVAVATLSAVFLSRFAHHSVGWVGPMAALPTWAQIIAIFLILDLVHWAVHLAHHKIPVLWKVHSVHHSTPDLYWMAAFRRHFVQEILFDGAKVFTVVLLGFNPTAALVYFASRVVFSLPAHANIRLRAGWLNYVFVTWETHRWHHASDPAIRDKNMALHLALWDLVFGTFYYPKNKECTELGVTGYPNYPTNFFVQQLVPFFYDRWSARAAAAAADESNLKEGNHAQSVRTAATHL